jgi:hypothetical protein
METVSPDEYLGCAVLNYVDNKGKLNILNIDLFLKSLKSYHVESIKNNLTDLGTSMPNFGLYSVIWLNTGALNGLIHATNPMCSPCLTSFYAANPSYKQEVFDFVTTSVLTMMNGDSPLTLGELEDKISMFQSSLNEKTDQLLEAIESYNKCNDLIAMLQSAIEDNPELANCTQLGHILGMLQGFNAMLKAMYMGPLMKARDFLNGQIGKIQEALDTIRGLANLLPDIDC